jgi:hypothetical protein
MRKIAVCKKCYIQIKRLASSKCCVVFFVPTGAVLQRYKAREGKAGERINFVPEVGQIFA